jgi:hypothetical protein
MDGLGELVAGEYSSPVRTLQSLLLLKKSSIIFRNKLVMKPRSQAPAGFSREIFNPKRGSIWQYYY